MYRLTYVLKKVCTFKAKFEKYCRMWLDVRLGIRKKNPDFNFERQVLTKPLTAIMMVLVA